MNYTKANIQRKKTGVLIYNAINASSFTIEDIATLIDLKSSRVIYEWMNGNKLPSIEHLLNLSLLLNLKMEELISWR